MFWNFQKSNLCTCLALFVFILVLNVQLFAQENFDETSYSRFYITGQSSIFSGTAFPVSFYAYKATGPAAANYFYAGEFGTSSGLGFGAGLGYQMREEIFMFSVELNYSINSHPDSKETLDETLFNGTNLTWQNFSNTFSQTQQKNSNILLFGSLGIFPFDEFNISFYGSVGLGMGWQSFTSAATTYASGRGFDIKTIGKADWYDVGDYSSGGKFSRSSFVMMFGLGSEYFITSNISLKAEWQYIWSSYTRENVLISSGAVNVYQDKKSYEYKVGNKLSLGVAYYFNASE